VLRADLLQITIRMNFLEYGLHLRGGRGQKVLETFAAELFSDPSDAPLYKLKNASRRGVARRKSQIRRQLPNLRFAVQPAAHPYTFRITCFTASHKVFQSSTDIVPFCRLLRRA